ncbi:phospholipase D-like domain-containing protein [soil metagenome]
MQVVAPTVVAPPALPAVEVVESWPLETSLDHPDVPDAKDVWLAMVQRAKTSIDLAELYASDQEPSGLHEIVLALEAAADRGVRVRFLVEQLFYSKYPETIDRFAKHRGFEVRHFDRSKTMGGILHAKYFVVDGTEAYVGSQNFDWRSLDHIQELGVLLRVPAAVSALAELFAADWDVEGGASAERYSKIAWPTFPVAIDGGELTLAASPRGFLSSDAAWDLPILVRRIDSAKKRVRIQLLTYKTKNRDGSGFSTLDDALRRAVGRGVAVELVVSSWNQAEPSIAALATAGVHVFVLTVPPASTGEIPFARVAHAKLAVFDDDAAWIGTSNWEGDYFSKSRNVSVFLDGAALASRVSMIFDGDRASIYVKPLQSGLAAP